MSDDGSPIGKNYQTSIWNYASGSLWAEYFSTSTPKAPLYFTLSDSLIGTTDPSSPNLLTLSVVALADVQSPVVVAPRNEWYMQVEDTSGSQPGLRYATYNDGQDSFELFSVSDRSPIGPQACSLIGSPPTAQPSLRLTPLQQILPERPFRST